MKSPTSKFIFAAVILYSCGWLIDSANPQPHGTLRQISGCSSGALLAATANDSCFSYQFAETLRVDFCLAGNCCPDKNRFKLTYAISSDTIYVAAADTAAQLCRCSCTYVLRAEFTDLPLDHYVFHCERNDYSRRLVHYNEHVYRRP